MCIHLEMDVFSLQGVGLRLQPLDLLQGALQVHVADVVDRLKKLRSCQDSFQVHSMHIVRDTRF